MPAKLEGMGQTNDYIEQQGCEQRCHAAFFGILLFYFCTRMGDREVLFTSSHGGIARGQLAMAHSGGARAFLPTQGAHQTHFGGCPSTTPARSEPLGAQREAEAERHLGA